MLTLIPKTESQSLQTDQQPSLSTGLGFDFATLGLRAHEARVDTIRRASQATAAKLQEVVVDHDERLPLISDVVVSTYRLLDPRRRKRKIERIQLCIESERSRELQQSSRRPLLQEPRRQGHESTLLLRRA